MFRVTRVQVAEALHLKVHRLKGNVNVGLDTLHQRVVACRTRRTQSVTTRHQDKAGRAFAVIRSPPVSHVQGPRWLGAMFESNGTACDPFTEAI